jgi:aspartate racemase
MKTLGLIGGIGPESTIEYYRTILRLYHERHGDADSPSVVINSIDVRRLLRLASTDLFALRAYLSVELERLKASGADVALLAANTPHVVFDELARDSPIPLISIVRATCDRAQALGLKRLGLLGTRFTMSGGFFERVFAPSGIQIAIPTEDEQTYLHGKYTQELLQNIFTRQTRDDVSRIITRLQERNTIDGVILGGTELPLLLNEPLGISVPLLNTAQIHAQAAVDSLWP